MLAIAGHSQTKKPLYAGEKKMVGNHLFKAPAVENYLCGLSSWL
jgi:hypothetical protein